MVERNSIVRWALVAVLVGLTFGIGASPVAAARPDPTNGFGPTDRPVFLIASLTDTFDVPVVNKVSGQLKNTAGDQGSPLLIVEIGTYVAGPDIGDTRYEGQDLSNLDLSGLPVPVADLDMNAATIVGSFCTYAGSIHLVTPDPAPISAAVQEAFFNASVYMDDLLATSPFPTTCELVYFIYDNQDGAGASFAEIGDALFLTPIELDCAATCAAEGDLFPHEPDDVLFSFEIAIDTGTGAIRVDVCLPVDVDIKPGSGTNPWNLGSEGVLPIALLSDAFFDAPGEVDVTTLEILGVGIDKWAVEDVNGDGFDDLMLHWRTQDLVDAGANKSMTFLELTGETNLGMCIEGSDVVRIVPPNK